MASTTLSGASFGSSIRIGSPDSREITKITMLTPMMLITPCSTRLSRNPATNSPLRYCLRPISCMLRQNDIGQGLNSTVSRQAKVTTGR